jgi:hypothetical protein
MLVHIQENNSYSSRFGLKELKTIVLATIITLRFRLMVLNDSKMMCTKTASSYAGQMMSQSRDESLFRFDSNGEFSKYCIIT